MIRTNLRFARGLGGLLLFACLVPLAEGTPNLEADTPIPPPPKKSDGKPISAPDLARWIDRQIAVTLEAEQIEPSPRCTDEEFLRRAYLDITGVIPPADKTVAFLDSKDPEKRGKLIEELLESKAYGRHQADLWQAQLLPRSSDNRGFLQYIPNLVQWLEGKFNSNVGWDVIVREILTSSGAVDKPGPVIYWLVNNSADKVTDNASRLFLGVQLQCAQCHNHPFTDWKQDAYWETAAFFLNVRPEGNPKMAAKKGATIRISENAKGGRKQKNLPESAKILPPRYLQGESPQVKGNQPLRPLFADWLTRSENPYFARAMVNRTWNQFFGRGLVNPVDDMHDGNAPSHPKILAELARNFTASNFDVKYLLRAICLSETYQRSSKPSGNNGDAGPELFSRMALRPLTAEQLYDSLTQIMGAEGRRANRNRAMQRGAGNPREAFVAFFAGEEGADLTEYQLGIPQVLRMMNSPQFNNNAALGSMLRPKDTTRESVEKIYLTILSRRPTPGERERIQNFLQVT
ncbi:MAG: DUF1549 and DUF1553 domain-containing protein [Gemmataceae bacterium]